MTIATERSKKVGALKIGFAAMAAAALTIGSMTPAYAADIQLGPADIIGFENGDEGSGDYNYDQWHVGNVDTPGTPVEESLEFGECSVTTLAAVERTVTQVLKGFPIDARPTTENTGDVSELQALIESMSIDVEQGSVTVQLPLFYHEAGENEPFFTTFRNSSGFGPGVHTLDGVELTDSSGTGFGGMDYLELLDTMVDPIEDGDVFEFLGVGFTGSEGAEINSISFAGDTYYFGTGDCLDDQDDDQNGDDEDDADDSDGSDAPRKPERVDTGL